ncbi:ricin-type beta-trefoil lectin domain protein [Streptomyces sp. NPDC054956]
MLALSTAMLLSAPYAAQAATPQPSGIPSPAAPQSVSSPPTAPAPSGPAEKARAEAVKTGKDVPVPELTTEFETTVVTPEGKLRTERSLLPARTKNKQGQWLALDDTLTAGADGTVVPKASSSALVISGGGTGPLATMTTEDGKQLSVSSPFPGALPKPVLSGNGALFQNVAPDTDLQVTATKWGGYTTVVILRSPAAAANPAARSLVFPTTAKGLTLAQGQDGSLTAAAGQETAFRAPAPLMWSAKEPRQAAARGSKFAALDAGVEPAAGSGVGPALSNAQGPSATATVAKIPVTRAEVSGPATGATGAIALAPSPGLLDGENTSYPIYVDPSWSPEARGKQHHAWVGSAPTWSGTGNFDRTGSADRDHPGVGYQGWETEKGIERALYEFAINGFSGAVINSATLRVSQYISSDWSCTNKYSVDVYRAREFDGSVSWNNHEIREWIGAQDVPGNGTNSNCYADIPVDFNVTNAMRDAIRDTSKPLAFALRGPEGTGDKIAFKRFSYDATLSAQYDFPPRVPENPHTVPAPRRVVAGDMQACANETAAQYGWITTSNPTLASTVSSPNQGQLTEWVNVWDETASVTAHQGWSGFVGTGSEARYETPNGTLKDGHAYAWATHGDDGLLRGPSSATCHFAADLTPPVMQLGQSTYTDTDLATMFPPAGNGQITKLGLGDTGSIPVTASDPNPSGLRTSGLACVEFGFDPQLVGATRQCGSPLNITGISVKPTHWGTNILYARALDEAGNTSQTLSYSFYVPWKPGPVAFGDTSGDARPDIVLPDNAGNLIAHGRASDGTAASMIPSGTTASALQGPEVGRTWKDYRVSHRGSRDPGRNVDDLFVHREPTTIGGQGGFDLFAYDNNLGNPGSFDLSTKEKVAKPKCDLKYSPSCDGYNSTVATWQYSSQITMTGSAKTTRTPGREITEATGVLAVEAGKLWFYPVKASQTLAAPTLVDGNTTWGDKDLMVPGNALRIGDAGDSAPALWVRDRATGDIFQYQMQTSVRGGDGLLAVTGLAQQPTARIGGGFTGATYARVGSDGDVTDDGVPDLWTQDTATGVLYVWPGVASDPVAGIRTVTGFTDRHARASGLTPTIEWRLDGDSKAIPAVNSAGTANTTSESSVTYPTVEVNGKVRPVGAFDDVAKSVVTGPINVVDTRQSFTISTWAKLDKPDGVIVSQDGARTSTFMVWADAGQWRFSIARGDSDTSSYDRNDTTTPANAFKQGIWTQLTATYNSTTGAMSLYVNGTLASSGYHPANTSPAPNGQLVLGRNKKQGQPASWLKGSVANLSIHQGYTPSVAASKISIRFAASPDICMDAPNNNSSDGQLPELWGCNTSPAQQFDINANGTMTINGQCVGANGNQTGANTPIVFSGCRGEGGQQWLPRADGSLYNPQSNSCLDVPWGRQNWGTTFVLWTCSGTGVSQRWSIPTVTTASLPYSP